MKKLRKLERKKAISPIIATVLLISLVLTIALVIWAYLQGFVEELVLKQDQPAQTICIDKVSISADIADLPDIVIINEGDVSLAGFQIEFGKLGVAKRMFHKCPLEVGESSYQHPDCNIDITGNYDPALIDNCREVKIVPVILGVGQRSGAQIEYNCETKTVTKLCL